MEVLVSAIVDALAATVGHLYKSSDQFHKASVINLIKQHYYAILYVAIYHAPDWCLKALIIKGWTLLIITINNC